MVEEEGAGGGREEGVGEVRGRDRRAWERDAGGGSGTGPEGGVSAGGRGGGKEPGGATGVWLRPLAYGLALACPLRLSFSACTARDPLPGATEISFPDFPFTRLRHVQTPSCRREAESEPGQLLADPLLAPGPCSHPRPAPGG